MISRGELTDLSRALSYALRHEPWIYELELDEFGWVPVEYLLAALRAERPTWSSLSETDVERMIAQSDKQRHELRGGRIRALYGHSTPQRLVREPTEPPGMLYHGTSPETVGLIRQQGLKPMGRQYVHLSADTLTAEQVGRRKSRTPVILRVRAKAASVCGASFYRGNEIVWLADAVPATFIDQR
ncbi:MAG TPA: RNA 2'-phosphotransferase [Rhizomicrobium sp.]|nr:RNA 2'-phosphotransferase [Rhizomicrobium sp.]